MAFTKRVAGGKDRFTWDEVKVDKDRENYLGKLILKIHPVFVIKYIFTILYTHRIVVFKTLHKMLCLFLCLFSYLILSFCIYRSLLNGSSWPMAERQGLAMV